MKAMSSHRSYERKGGKKAIDSAVGCPPIEHPGINEQRIGIHTLWGL